MTNKGEMTVFFWLDTEYRTNSDCSLIERNDGLKLGWNKTGSLNVYNAAKKALKGYEVKPIVE